MLRTESKQILLSIIAISILIIAFVGVSYAAFQTLVSSDENSISTGTISLELSNQSDSISISNAMPISDEEGKGLTGNGNVYDFSVHTILSKDTTINYEVSLEKVHFGDENLKNRMKKLMIKDVKSEIWKKENNYPSCEKCGITLNYIIEGEPVLCPSCKYND